VSADSSSQSASPRKPWFALFIATAGGLGYIPFAPGTFGSLAGLIVTTLPSWALFRLAMDGVEIHIRGLDPILLAQIVLAVAVALIGVWAATRAAEFWQQKDPQRVVIDEVSGQHLTLLLGCSIPVASRADVWNSSSLGLMTLHTALSWKYLLLGLILFRVFDIWKPFPARQAESLPGGWGIMADDWIAGIYAGIVLAVARSVFHF